MKHLNGRKRILAAGALAAVGLWVYYGFILSPLARAALFSAQQVGQAARQFRESEQALVQEPQLQHQHRDLDARVSQLQALVPTEEQLPMVIQRLTEIAAQTGVKVQTLTPQPSAVLSSDRPSLYREVPIQFEGLAGYHQLGMFISRLESGDQPIQVRSLRLDTNPKLLRRHTIKMTLIACLALTAPPPVVTQLGSKDNTTPPQGKDARAKVGKPKQQ